MTLVLVDADFPGGNIEVEAVRGDTVRVRPAMRDTDRNWFYWYFRVRQAAGRTITVQFTAGPVFPSNGPSVSLDGGRTWTRVSPEDDRSFRFAVPDPCLEVRFCLGLPYVAGDLHRFLARSGLVDHPRLTRTELCQSEAGRPVELIKISPPSDTAEHEVLLTCRHHSCEATASYALEGLIEALLKPAHSDHEWLARSAAVSVVPFMDTDGVEQGDQGKSRRPHDHNRDYGATEERYSSVRAVKELVRSRRFDVALDLHCPWLRGPYNESVYFVGCPEPDRWVQVGLLARQLERATGDSPLRYRRSSDVAFGEAWNTPANYSSSGGTPLTTFDAFVRQVHPDVLAAILEIPYTIVDGVEVTADRARRLGADLATALARHLVGRN